jgi:hypothetical protein
LIHRTAVRHLEELTIDPFERYLESLAAKEPPASSAAKSGKAPLKGLSPEKRALLLSMLKGRRDT